MGDIAKPSRGLVGAQEALCEVVMWNFRYRIDLEGAERERLHLALKTTANGRSSCGNGLDEGLPTPVEYSNRAKQPS